MVGDVLPADSLANVLLLVPLKETGNAEPRAARAAATAALRQAAAAIVSTSSSASRRLRSSAWRAKKAVERAALAPVAAVRIAFAVRCMKGRRFA
jgi:hypothetical protein